MRFTKPFASLGLLGLMSTAALAQNVSLPDSILAPGDTLQWVRKVPYYCEGPAYDAATGYVYFTQQIGNNVPNWPIWRVKPGVDTGMVWYRSYQNNGLAFDPQGRLISAQNGRLSRLKNAAAGDSGVVDTTLVVSPSNGVSFNQANDLSIGTRGDLYFTALGSSVYYLNPARQLSVATSTAFPISSANGIEWIEEEKAVYVNSATNNGNVYKFGIDTTTGVFNARSAFLTTTIPSPDGGTVDIHGNRYVASYGQGEIRVFNAAGAQIGYIRQRLASGIYDSVSSSGRVGISGNACNAVFGGPDMKTLYITGDGGLYSIRLKIPGRPPVYTPTSIRRSSLVKQHEIVVPQGLGAARDLRGRVMPSGWGGGTLLIPSDAAAK
jgi:sugar lactone lactonase YvrE